MAERLTVAQDVVGSIPTRRPKFPSDSLQEIRFKFSSEFTHRLGCPRNRVTLRKINRELPDELAEAKMRQMLLSASRSRIE